METLDTIAARFDARAPRYDESVQHVALAAAAARFAAEGLTGDGGAPRRVLDVATGTGLVLRALADLALLPVPAQPGDVVGLDASAGMLAVARTHLREVTWVEGDAQRLPYDDGAFDLVTCVTGLHLMADPVAALAEWRRVLAPAGRVVLATFASDAPAGAPRDPDDPHARVGTPELLAGLAKAARFQVRRSERWEHVVDGADAPDDVCLLTELTADAA
jgi:ubiquinone/menaquinone biosynthesis C-methylase UbiE